MAEEKKPGFFKRLFGWGKAAPEAETPPPALVPEALPPPAPVVEPVPEPVVTIETVPLVEPIVEPVAAEVAAPTEPLPEPVVETAAATDPTPESAPEWIITPEPAPAPEVVVELEAVIDPEPLASQLPDKVELAPETIPDVTPAVVTMLPEVAVPLVVSIPEPAPARPVKRSFWQRLKEGLSRTSSSLTNGITDLFTKRKLDAATLEDLEDILIQADIGIDASARIAKAVGAGRYEKGVTPDAVRAILARELADILRPVAKPLAPPANRKPITILMVGVNGSGKTTTIGKLAAKFRADGLKVVMAAGDTFRAAAIEQLKVWGERTGTPVIAREQGADAAGLAYDALKQAQETGADVLLIDTAGRLQNKQGLMEELAKIVRVLKKLDPDAPHATLLVLDATVGQNAVSQVEAFTQIAGVTGLVMTKLDGTARGGILVALAQKFGVPVHLIGVGEGVDDLEVFDPDAFARAIAGLEESA